MPQTQQRAAARPGLQRRHQRDQPGGVAAKRDRHHRRGQHGPGRKSPDGAPDSAADCARPSSAPAQCWLVDALRRHWGNNLVHESRQVVVIFGRSRSHSLCGCHPCKADRAAPAAPVHRRHGIAARPHSSITLKYFDELRLRHSRRTGAARRAGGAKRLAAAAGAPVFSRRAASKNRGSNTHRQAAWHRF